MKSSNPRDQGFTLLELSIVLVIIGVLMGAILTGADMIRQAEIRSVLKDVDGFKAAMNTFRLKYNGLPGDLRNATDFFSSAGVITNGNGDGLIDYPLTAANEGIPAWQHLSLAGLVPGDFDGQISHAGYADYTLVGDVNAPRSKLKSAIYTLNGTASNTGNSAFFGNNVIILGGQKSSGFGNLAFLETVEAYQIDQKYDDGNGSTGLIRGRLASHGGVVCLTAGQYDFSLTGDHCVLHFMIR